MPKLKNKRHEAFCMEYRRNGFNGLQAYKTVYKCSDVVAQKNSSKLLTRVDIKARLDELGEKDKVKYQKEIKKIKKLEYKNKILKLEIKNKELENQKISLELKKQLLKKMKKDEIDLFLKDDIENLIKLLGDDLYFILNTENNLIKIGRSRDPISRLDTLKRDYGIHNLEILDVKKGMGYLEPKLHKEFKDLNVKVKYQNSIGKEWFQYSDLIKIKIQSI